MLEVYWEVNKVLNLELRLELNPSLAYHKIDTFCGEQR